MIPIDIQPGVTNRESKARHTTNWREAHLIRWEGDTVIPFGGWELTTLGPFASPIRQMHRWMTNAGMMITAYLCEQHLYVDMGENVVDITPVDGIAAPSENNGGYGDKKYNAGAYGTPRPGESRLRNYTPTYTLDNWGDQLRAMTSTDGRLLKWDPATPATKATAVVGAPISNRMFVITPERHIMLFGYSGKVDAFCWSDQEDDTNWAFLDITSKAGYFDLEPSAPIVTVKQFFGGIIMFTTGTAYIIKYSGMPYIYGYYEIGKVPVPVSPLSLAETPDGVMWPSTEGFWMFTGSTILPVECSIWDWIKRNIDFSNSFFQAYTINMFNRSELWWSFVGNEDEERINSRIAVFDYRSKWWSMARMGRSCGYTYGSDPYPICSDGTKVYKHGLLYSYPGSEMPWIETFNMNLNDGETLVTLNEIQPEIVGDRDILQFSLYKQYDRTRQDTEKKTPDRKVFADGRVQFRETAKDFRMRIQVVGPGYWTLGPMLVDVKQRGKKTTDKKTA